MLACKRSCAPPNHAPHPSRTDATRPPVRREEVRGPPRAGGANRYRWQPFLQACVRPIRHRTRRCRNHRRRQRLHQSPPLRQPRVRTFRLHSDRQARRAREAFCPRATVGRAQRSSARHPGLAHSQPVRISHRSSAGCPPDWRAGDEIRTRDPLLGSYRPGQRCASEFGRGTMCAHLGCHARNSLRNRACPDWNEAKRGKIYSG